MTHITCRLTAKNRDQLRNPTLGNRVWATLPTYLLTAENIYMSSFHTFSVDVLNRQLKRDRTTSEVDANDHPCHPATTITPTTTSRPVH